jgi:RNA polymerase sigma factor (sigma-70 family)
MTISDEEFTRVYKRYHRVLLKNTTRQLNNPDEAADVVQDAFKALLNHPDYSKLEKNVIGWLTTCCQHKCSNLIQRAKTKARCASALMRGLNVFAEEPDPFEYACLQERNNALLETMADLSAAQANGLRMYYFKHMTYEAISVQTGKSITAVSTLLERARKKIKVILKTQIHEF